MTIKAAEETSVSFTAAHWSMLQNIPSELKAIREILGDSVQASKAETAAIRAAIVASDQRCEQQLALANHRIDEAHKHLAVLEKRFGRWAAKATAYTGAAGCFAAILVWAAKAFLKIG